MKHESKKRLLPLLVMALIALMSAGLTSCSKDKDNEPDIPDWSLSVSPSSLSLLSEQNAQVNFNIHGNVTWSISEIPEWLNLSATSGKGDAIITVTALSANASDETRTATLKISSLETVDVELEGDEEGEATKTLTAEVTINQMPKYKADCKVNYKEVFTLANSMCFEFEIESNVSYFYAGYLNASSAGWPDSKIIETITAEDAEAYTPGKVKDSTFGTNSVTPGTEYYLCAVGYDADGNQGPLTKTKVQIPNLPNNYPFVDIDQIRFDDADGWSAYYSKNAATLGYYVYGFFGNDALNLAQSWVSATAAKIVKQSIDNNSLTLWPNSSLLYFANKSDVFLTVSWGLDARNNLSPVINADIETNGSSNRPALTKKGKNAHGFVGMVHKDMEAAAKSLVRISKK